MNCTNCDNHKYHATNNCLGGCANGTNVKYMFVSDYARTEDFGAHSLSQNRGYFNGNYRKIFLETIQKAGINLNETYFTGLVRCTPKTKSKEKPKTDIRSIKACCGYLEQEIANVKPKVIIACGAAAYEYFFPDTKLADKRCQVQIYLPQNVAVIGINHPEVMAVTVEFDLIIEKAFEQARRYVEGTLPIVTTNYVPLLTLKDVQDVAKRVKEVPVFTYDLETTSLWYVRAKILSCGLSWKVDTAVAFPWLIKDEEACEKILNDKTRNGIKTKTLIQNDPPLKNYWGNSADEVWRLFQEILHTAAKKGGHNSFYDNSVLYMNGLTVNNYAFDTMAMLHLLDEERPLDLDYCSWIYTNKGGYKMEKDKYLPTSKTSWAHIPTDTLLKYNAGDADTTLEIYHKFRERVIAEGKASLLGNRVIPFQKNLMKASWRGLCIDLPYMKKKQAELDTKMINLKAEMGMIIDPFYAPDRIQIISSTDEMPLTKNRAPNTVYFNVNSTKQLRELFVDKMKLIDPAKDHLQTGTGAVSVGESTLLALKKRPIAKALLEFRKTAKLKNTYVDKLIADIGDESVVHPLFQICGTVTGRLSSARPNVQQVPRNKEIKNIFVARPGYRLVEVDFSQHELRVLAGRSQDPTMCKVYKVGGDIHMKTAAGVFGKQEADISGEQRTIAKTINFSSVYGAGPSNIRQQLEDQDIYISLTQAGKYLDGFSTTYPLAVSFLQKQSLDYRNKLRIVIPSGRERHAIRILPESYRAQAQMREGANFSIQGFASDIAFECANNFMPELEAIDCWLVNTVHDSYLFEVAIGREVEFADILRKHTWLAMPELNGHCIKTDMAIAWEDEDGISRWGNKAAWDMEKYEPIKKK